MTINLRLVDAEGVIRQVDVPDDVEGVLTSDGLGGLTFEASGPGGDVEWDDVLNKPATFPPVIGGGAGDAVAGNDARLTDARTPTAHTHPASAISDSTVAGRAVLTAADAPAQRTALGLGTAAVAAATDFATAAQGVDARTPTAHATSHKSGGSDAIKLDELAAPTDVTTLNATEAGHGLMQKLPGGTTTYLRADGGWGAPTAALPDLVVTANSTAGTDRTIAAGYSAYVPDYYEIGSGLFLEIAAGSVMEIG